MFDTELWIEYWFPLTSIHVVTQMTWYMFISMSHQWRYTFSRYTKMIFQKFIIICIPNDTLTVNVQRYVHILQYSSCSACVVACHTTQSAERFYNKVTPKWTLRNFASGWKITMGCDGFWLAGKFGKWFAHRSSSIPPGAPPPKH